ncbi:MAG: ribonuclease [Clostridia bacterium]|nr:ribonuclease [Clostridia bacterium]
MGGSSKKSLNKKQILYAVIAIIAVIAIYFIATKFIGNQNGTNDPASVSEKTDGGLTVIEESPTVNVTGTSGANATEKPGTTSKPTVTPKPTDNKIDQNGTYYSKEDVALYIHTYGKLPSNFVTKEQAEKDGWSGNGSDPLKNGKVIGGDRFGNYEGLLPKKSGRTYYECDIDTNGKARGVKRIVFSNDGLIYYTEDHYESFELLYGKP